MSNPKNTANLECRRYLILVAACITAGLTGVTYMWSIFTSPLIQAHGWTSSEVALAYSLYFIVQFIMGFASGVLQRRLGTRPLAIVGGVLLSLGWMLMSQADTVPLLYLTFSLCGGAGAGLAYNSAVSTATKWFPDKKGFANGLCIGTTGLMPIVFAPLGNFLIQAFDLANALIIVGAIPLVLYLATAWIVNTPPDSWKPAGWHPQEAGAAVSTGRDYTSAEMMKTPLFWCMLLLFVAATSSGAMVTSHAAPMGAEFVGLTAAQAALQVSLLALGNFAGRFGLGALSDRIGRYNALLIALCVSAIDMLFVFQMANNFVTFAIAIMLAGACYGGTMTVMPSLCGDLFGTKNFGQNYAILFGGFALANLVGPMVAAQAVDITGSYHIALYIAAALAACGIVIVFVMRGLSRKGGR